MLAASILALTVLAVFEGIAVSARIARENAEYLQADAYAFDLAWKRYNESYQALRNIATGIVQTEVITEEAAPMLYHAGSTAKSYTTIRRITDTSDPSVELGVLISVDVEWGSMALATGLMFLLSLTRGFAPLAPLASAAAFGATAWLLWADRPLPTMERPALPRLRTTGNFPLLAAVAVLLSLAYGINDSTSYLRFEEFRDTFGLSRLTLGAGLFLAGQLADRRREYLPLAAILGGAATMGFHAMTLEGFPPAALFYANEFFWSFSLLFILIVFMEASLRTTRPELGREF